MGMPSASWLSISCVMRLPCWISGRYTKGLWAHAVVPNAGLKVTLPRVRILKLLEGVNARHLSAEEIHRLLAQSGDDVGLATVYRVLTQFEGVGLVKRHYFEGGSSIFE